MTAFSVDLAQLDETVLRLRRLERFIEDRLANIDRRARALPESWLGDAATVQRIAHEEWLVGAEQMRQATAALRLAAATAHENYSAAVRANRDAWAR